MARGGTRRRDIVPHLPQADTCTQYVWSPQTNNGAGRAPYRLKIPRQKSLTLGLWPQIMVTVALTAQCQLLQREPCRRSELT